MRSQRRSGASPALRTNTTPTGHSRLKGSRSSSRSTRTPIDTGNGERYVGLLRSQGSVMDLLKAGYSDQDLGITELERLARSELGADPAPWY